MSEPPEHIFWAGLTRDIVVMAQAHAHSQVEINLMLSGASTYFFGGREIVVRGGQFVVFWGAVPHQTVAVEGRARFVCVYLPIEMVLAMPLGHEMRRALLDGGMLAAREPLEPGGPNGCTTTCCSRTPGCARSPPPNSACACDASTFSAGTISRPSRPRSPLRGVPATPPSTRWRASSARMRPIPSRSLTPAVPSACTRTTP